MLLTSIGVARPRVLIALLALTSVVTARDAEAQQSSTLLSSAVARSIPATPDSRHVFVLDSAHLLTAPEIAALQDSAQQLQAATGADIAFVTLPTLHGGAVEEAALAIGRAWKVGSAGAPGDPTRNRGLVMLYVPDKKSVAGANLRVEVGRGLEGAITDGGGSRAILEAIKPSFRAKRYGDGFIAGFNVAAQLIIAEQPSATPTPASPVTHEPDGAPWFVLLFVPLGLIIVAVILMRRRSGAPVMDLAPHNRSWAPNRAAGIVPFPMIDHSPTVSSSDDSSRSSGDSGSSSSSDSSPSSDSGSFGGGGGFSGGGSSDSV